jgi:hypothetical protein
LCPLPKALSSLAWSPAWPTPERSPCSSERQQMPLYPCFTTMCPCSVPSADGFMSLSGAWYWPEFHCLQFRHTRNTRKSMFPESLTPQQLCQVGKDTAPSHFSPGGMSQSFRVPWGWSLWSAVVTAHHCLVSLHVSFPPAQTM